MAENKSYAGIDYFRLIAALLIVALHTSPLTSLSETGNFILTRVIARVAVPFFFMTSGFFLISRYNRNAKKLWNFVKRTALIYGTAILLYIPINIYNGYFRRDNLLPNIIKDIVFDGTIYHLWYLPASMIGAQLAWYLVRKLHDTKALLAASVLYLFGLFGDSYFGAVQKFPFFNSLYELIFQVSDYTRNGIFFAPLFFIIGGLIAESRHKISFGKSICGLGVSFIFLFAEALLLHHFHLPRHDSMYMFLPPVMYFLFHVILHFKGERPAGFRTLSLVVYVIHPMIIVMIRLFAKVFYLQEMFVENSLIHYFAVCLASVLCGGIATVLWNRYKPEKKNEVNDRDRAYLEINYHNLEHNVSVLKRALLPQCQLMAVVKANAYGHGMYEIATHINRLGIKAFAVATIDEGIALRRYGIAGIILILGYTPPIRARELYKFDLVQTLISYEYAIALNNRGYRIKTHIKVDTGMHRLGFEAEDFDKIMCVFQLKHLDVVGIFTHLCAADSLMDADVCFTHRQIDSFYHLLNQLKQERGTVPKFHIQSSYGLLNYPELKCDYVRAGVALYGVLSSPNDKTKLHLDLKPVLSLKSQIVLLRQIEKGSSVGYGRAFIAQRDSVIAIIPVGYADGFPRNLSCQKGSVLIAGQKAPIIGKICMDQFAVDVTDFPGIKIGETVTFIGQDGDREISAPEAADGADSISNELLSRMGQRLKVVITNI